MAKRGIDIAGSYSFVNRDGKTFMRKAHNAGNTHNHARQACMRQQLSGKHFANKEQQRAAFRAAAHACNR